MFEPRFRLDERAKPDALRGQLVATWIACGVGATLLTAMYWPGLATNDTGHRLVLAWSLIRGASGIPESILQQVFPPAMSLVAALLRWLTGTWGVMTVLQAWWFLGGLSTLALIALGEPARREHRFPVAALMSSAALVAVPLVWNHAIAMLPDAWVAGALAVLASVLLRAQRVTRLSHGWIAAWCVAALLACTFRHNTLTVLPVLVLWTMRACRRHASPWRTVLTLWTGLAASVAVSAALPPLVTARLGWRPADVPATIMVWEHAGALYLSQHRTSNASGNSDDIRLSHIATEHSLDHIAAGQPVHATARAMQRFDWVAFNSVVYGPDAPLPARAIRDDGRAARAAFWKLVRQHPLLYARSKVRIWASVMGLRHDGPVIFVDANPPLWANELGVDLSLRRGGMGAAHGEASFPRRILAWGARMTRATIAFWMPYTWFCASAAALAVALCLGRRARRACEATGTARLQVVNQDDRWSNALWLWVLAGSYYAGFLIVSPGFEWRYFLPSFVLLWGALLLGIWTLGSIWRGLVRSGPRGGYIPA